jgi:hypothetical protein
MIANVPNNFDNVTSVNIGKHKATQPTEPITSWETSSRLANTVTILILCTRARHWTFSYTIQMQFLPHHYFNIHIYVSLPSTPRSSYGIFPIGFPIKNIYAHVCATWPNHLILH